MRFGAPYNTLWLWLVPIMVLFYLRAFRIRKKAMERFAREEMLPEISKSVNMGRKKLKAYMLVLAATFLIVALMRPQWGFKWQEVKRQGLDIMIALDTSKSMLAEDVLPNRLERSKLAIKDLIRKLNGDRIGLVAFAGRAFLQCPLTVDYDGFMLALEDVTVDTIPVGGTSLARALYAAMEGYEGSVGKNKVLILITDGEDHDGGIEPAVLKAKEDNVRIFCVGIGTSQGELIPIDAGRGRREFLKDRKGDVVKTRLDEETLQTISLETGGVYVQGKGAELGLDIIYDRWLSKMEKQDFKSRMEKQYTERFELPLAIALLLLMIEPFIGDRQKRGG